MSRSIRVLCDLIRIDTIGEAQDSLHVCTASDSWHGSSRTILAIFRPCIAPPSDHIDILVNVCLAFGRRVSGDHVEVFRVRDLGLVDVLVIGLEGCWVDFGVVVAVYVVERRSPLESTSGPFHLLLFEFNLSINSQ